MQYLWMDFKHLNSTAGLVLCSLWLLTVAGIVACMPRSYYVMLSMQCTPSICTNDAPQSARCPLYVPLSCGKDPGLHISATEHC